MYSLAVPSLRRLGWADGSGWSPGSFFFPLVHAEEITVMAISLLFPNDPRLDLSFPSSYNLRRLC